MNFQDVKEFLTSWGLHFDTPNGDSNDIPYPQVYERMRVDAFKVGGDELLKFISSITSTTDGRTYLCADLWEAVEQAWDNRLSPEQKKSRVHPLQFEYCECGCKCHSGTSKGVQYSIFNSLRGPLPFMVRRGHGGWGPEIGSKYATWKEAVQAAQDDWDKIP